MRGTGVHAPPCSPVLHGSVTVTRFQPWAAFRRYFGTLHYLAGLLVTSLWLPIGLPPLSVLQC